MKKVKNALILYLLFFKIGLFTFGGGLAMISLIEREFSIKRKWIDKDELVNMITISESTPGPLAINMATYVGNKIAGIFGAILGTLGVVTPSFIIIYVISLFLDRFLEVEVVQFAFLGINCAVGLLLLTAGISLLKTMPKDWVAILLFGLSMIATLCILFYSIDFSTIYLILIGGAIYLICQVIKKKGKLKEGNKK